MTDEDRDLLIVAITAFCEASGEGQDGIRAVCWAIVNRHNAGKWFSAKTLAACCLLPSQFSSWNTNDPNRRRAFETPSDNPIMAMCLQESADAISGASTDPTDGATHYFAPRSVSAPPAWTAATSGAILTAEIGNHRFYRGVA